MSFTSLTTKQMKNDLTPSYIQPSNKWTPDSPRAKELMEELCKETGAQSFSILLYDCPMPCPEIKATGYCRIGHRYAIRGTIEDVTLHEMWVQMLKQCDGHRVYFKNSDHETES